LVASLRVAFEIIIVVEIIGVGLVTVGGRIVPAPSVQRRIQRLQIRGAAERDAVDLRVYAVLVGRGVDGNGNWRVLRPRGGGQE
jgi:type II secretory pathway pseudopilin PulG